MMFGRLKVRQPLDEVSQPCRRSILEAVREGFGVDCECLDGAVGDDGLEGYGDGGEGEGDGIGFPGLEEGAQRSGRCAKCKEG